MNDFNEPEADGPREFGRMSNGEKEQYVEVDGVQYRKFILYPEPVNDGTSRCISCGQIDDERYHDDAFCSGMEWAKQNASDNAFEDRVKSWLDNLPVADAEKRRLADLEGETLKARIDERVQANRDAAVQASEKEPRTEGVRIQSVLRGRADMLRIGKGTTRAVNAAVGIMYEAATVIDDLTEERNAAQMQVYSVRQELEKGRRAYGGKEAAQLRHDLASLQQHVDELKQMLNRSENARVMAVQARDNFRTEWLKNERILRYIVETMEKIGVPNASEIVRKQR